MARDKKGIFISYRRATNAAHAGWLGDTLSQHFGGSLKVYRDIDSIEPGLDFVEDIQRALDSTAVLLAVIGDSWLTTADATGRPRLQNPDDYVRLELADALQRKDVRVIPVLVQGAEMPQAHELPNDLAALSRRQAFELRDANWKDDVERLIERLENVVGIRKEGERRGPDRPPTDKQTEKIAPSGDRVTQPTLFRRMLLLYPPATALGWVWHILFYAIMLMFLIAVIYSNIGPGGLQPAGLLFSSFFLGIIFGPLLLLIHHRARTPERSAYRIGMPLISMRTFIIVVTIVIVGAVLVSIAGNT